MKIKDILTLSNCALISCLGTSVVFEVILVLLGFLLHNPEVYGIGIIAFFITLFVFITSLCIYIKNR